VYPFIQENLLKLGDYGKLTFPMVLGFNPWLVIVPFAIIVSGILLLMDRSTSARKRDAREYICNSPQEINPNPVSRRGRYFGESAMSGYRYPGSNETENRNADQRSGADLW
jgi:hypothetical protein